MTIDRESKRVPGFLSALVRRLDAGAMVYGNYIRFLQPLLFALKRRSRNRLFNDDIPCPPGTVDIQAVPRTESPDPACAWVVRQTRAFLAGYRGPEHAGALARGTAVAIDIAAWGSLENYARHIYRGTGRTIRKMAQRAERRHYYVRMFDPGDHPGEMSAILHSKLFRSGGVVPQALFHRLTGVRSGHTGQLQSRCPHHWTAHLGIFLPAAAGQGDRLCGYVKLRRCGNLLYLLNFIGHGEHLGSGIMDLLHMETLRWVFDPANPQTRGVAHYMYGAAEHAGIGLAGWKHSRAFRPVLVRAD